MDTLHTSVSTFVNVGLSCKMENANDHTLILYTGKVIKSNLIMVHNSENVFCISISPLGDNLVPRKCNVFWIVQNVKLNIFLYYTCIVKRMAF